MSRRPVALVAFDVDNCLMPVNQPATEAVRLALARLAEARGHVAFASGKPCVYLSGLARGLGLVGASLVGENGAEIWVGGTMPAERLPVDIAAEELAALAAVEAEVVARYGERVFLQPNAVGVTAFPMAEGLTPADIDREIVTPVTPSIARYVHVDSVDWAVTRFNKGAALLRLAERLGVDRARIAAAGDSGNDLPMMAVAAFGLWVGDPRVVVSYPNVECFATIDEALARLTAFVA